MKIRCFVIATGIFVATFFLAGCSKQKSVHKTAMGPIPKIDASTTYDLTIKGGKISKRMAGKLEEKLESNPNDLEARIQLLSYYFAHNNRRPARKHVLWVIKNCPDAVIAGLPYARLDPILDGKSYKEARDLWIRNVDKNPKNAQIIWNAANFFLIYDSSRTEALLKNGQALEPNNSRWSKQLGHFYELQANSNKGMGNQANAKESLRQYEDAYNSTKDEIQRHSLLPDLAKSAFTAGEYDKAKHYADLMLKPNSNFAIDGNAIHQGNLILGRLALRSGNIAEARMSLIAAGKTPGSPQLGSFGPNMMLAKELLEKGQKDVVLEYFKLCGKFWDMGKDKLERWTKIVKSGGIPDFGANLNY